MLKILLAPLSLLYAIISKIRNFLYNHDIINSSFFSDTTVISIGNLAVGGTGKTPHTEFLINFLKDKFNIAILSRGYKRKSKGFLYVTPNLSYEQTGDEPLQISSKFNNIPVAVCKKRKDGINKLIKDKNPEAIILDDAFQHRKIKPNLSILLTEYKNPFFKDYFLPLGRLRDNAHEYIRADIIIITNCPNDVKPIEKSIWRDNMKLMPYQKHFFSSVKYTNITNISNKNDIKTIDNLKNHDIVIVTGIANPKYFINFVEENISNKTHTLSFSDHKKFNNKDIEKISNTFNKINNKNKIILTTEKDAIRLKNIIPDNLKSNIYFQEIEIELLFDKKDEFKQLIIKNIENKTISII